MNVHGIGCTKEAQVVNQADFKRSVDKVEQGGHYKCHYDLHVEWIDWKTLVDNSSIR
jgi:hypothetical protein